VITVVAMCVAGLALLVIGVMASRNAIAEARGLETIVALRHVCVAVPLATFGALHLFGPQLVAALVPRYMPWRLFGVYFVGCTLVAASVSIATRTAVRSAGLLLGIMMFAFVVMIHLPGALARPDRIIWTIVFREMSFGGAGWIRASACSASTCTEALSSRPSPTSGAPGTTRTASRMVSSAAAASAFVCTSLTST
jgi:hypothetical protein